MVGLVSSSRHRTKLPRMETKREALLYEKSWWHYGIRRAETVKQTWHDEGCSRSYGEQPHEQSDRTTCNFLSLQDKRTRHYTACRISGARRHHALQGTRLHFGIVARSRCRVILRLKLCWQVCPWDMRTLACVTHLNRLMHTRSCTFCEIRQQTPQYKNARSLA